MDTFGYVVGTRLMEHQRPIAYHSETFLGAILNYSRYERVMYMLIQVVKCWWHCLHEKGIVTWSKNKPLQFLKHKERLRMHTTRNGLLIWSSDIRTGPARQNRSVGSTFREKTVRSTVPNCFWPVPHNTRMTHLNGWISNFFKKKKTNFYQFLYIM